MLRRPFWLLLAVAGFSSMTEADVFTIQYQQTATATDTLVLLSDETLPTSDGLVPQLNTLLTQQRFSGKASQLVEILTPAQNNSPQQRLIVLGSGHQQQLTVKSANLIGATLASHLIQSPAQQITVDIRQMSGSLSNTELATQIAHGMQLRSYRFDKHQTQKSAQVKKHVTFVVEDSKAATARHQQLDAIASGVFLARDLTNEPANIATPEYFAAQAKQLTKLGVKVTVLNEKDIEKNGLGALFAVGKGSINPPRLVIAHWQGSKQAPLAIVGKGITFDTGGYNLKTSAESIHRMTSDMAGAASTLGVIHALAAQKAPVNVVGIMAMAENRISDSAYLPGDIITTAAGLTVEILSTDAEGRLVLADALWWANKHYKPAAIVDLATLTGAKVTAVGAYYAGAFSQHDALLEQVRLAGEKVDERIWRLPLSDDFAPELKSRVADLRNTGRSTGASSAAYFLQQFVADTPWVHLDIAGNALVNGNKGVTPEGATGFGVRLLTEWALTQQ